LFVVCTNYLPYIIVTHERIALPFVGRRASGRARKEIKALSSVDDSTGWRSLLPENLFASSFVACHRERTNERRDRRRVTREKREEKEGRASSSMDFFESILAVHGVVELVWLGPFRRDGVV